MLDVRSASSTPDGGTVTLAEKRDVIEVLLCGWQGGCYEAGHRIGSELAVIRRAVACRQAVRRRRNEAHEQWCLAAIESAYRLIESSPTLVAEWFTRPATGKHLIDIDAWKNERVRGKPGDLMTVVRWSCSCGRLGPPLPLEGTIGGLSRVTRRARSGGERHVMATYAKAVR